MMKIIKRIRLKRDDFDSDVSMMGGILTALSELELTEGSEDRKAIAEVLRRGYTVENTFYDLCTLSVMANGLYDEIMETLGNINTQWGKLEIVKPLITLLKQRGIVITIPDIDGFLLCGQQMKLTLSRSQWQTCDMFFHLFPEREYASVEFRAIVEKKRPALLKQLQTVFPKAKKKECDTCRIITEDLMARKPLLKMNIYDDIDERKRFIEALADVIESYIEKTKGLDL